MMYNYLKASNYLLRVWLNSHPHYCMIFLTVAPCLVTNNRLSLRSLKPKQNHITGGLCPGSQSWDDPFRAQRDSKWCMLTLTRTRHQSGSSVMDGLRPSSILEEELAAIFCPQPLSKLFTGWRMIPSTPLVAHEPLPANALLTAKREVCHVHSLWKFCTCWKRTHYRRTLMDARLLLEICSSKHGAERVEEV